MSPVIVDRLTFARDALPPRPRAPWSVDYQPTPSAINGRRDYFL
jgi:hypothetical protein